jgi:hypothetical protein
LEKNENYTYLNSQPKPTIMKKALIGSLVGAIIIFIWQFLSFALINFHKPAQQYTEKQDALMNFLNSQGLKEGGYFLPNLPDGASRDDQNKYMEETEGKPWATIQYHSKMENDMVMSMIRGFLVNFVTVLLFCWLIGKMAAPSFGTILTAALAVGLISFLNQPYTGFIWYKNFDIWASFLDAIVMWGLAGMWLGWWLRRRRDQLSTVRIPERERELA